MILKVLFYNNIKFKRQTETKNGEEFKIFVRFIFGKIIFNSIRSHQAIIYSILEGILLLTTY